ncbi:MAG: hypothetical protein EXS59_00165 [Candidatus Taylorbacteria bacterium]|nr:hypothetical protein [Candidatus Taylorbacteria bacterium]
MNPNLTETGWEKELGHAHLGSLAATKLATAIRGKGSFPSVTAEEFDQITDEVFFIRIGEIGYILKRNKSGLLCLVDEDARNRSRRKMK